MDAVFPSYCQDFRCLADRCTGNCCIGWEIGIDSDTASLYRNMKGAFGERLRANIAEDDCFVLQNERCPFLNEKNLCDIIVHCGEDALCQICRDHPRYFEWFSDRKEGGIGLSCEEAARLILTTNNPTFIRTQTEEEPEETDPVLLQQLTDVRADLFAILDDEDKSLSRKLCEILAFASSVQQSLDGNSAQEETEEEMPEQRIVQEMISLFSGMEPINSEWPLLLQLLEQQKMPCEKCPPKAEAYCINLCRYFLWRYFLTGVFDGELLSKVKFAVVSTLFIYLLCANDLSLTCFIRKSTLYSAQMEYSDENRDAFFVLSETQPCLQCTAISRLVQAVF